MSCSKWREKANGEQQKKRNTTVWRCGFCVAKQKQMAERKAKAAA